MTQNVRVITASLASSAIALGRSAEQWRNDFAVSHFGGREDVDFGQFTSNAKGPKPVFEVHERQLTARDKKAGVENTYQLTLMRRNNANKLTEVDSIRVGMFGKLLREASDAPQADVPAEIDEIEACIEVGEVNA
jgi:hypothetical protein